MGSIGRQPPVKVVRRLEAERGSCEEAEGSMIAGPRVEGLAQVCRQGVLYLDMNLASILIRQSDGHPVLTDFGAAEQSVVGHARSSASYMEGYLTLEQASVRRSNPKASSCTRTVDSRPSGPIWM